MQLLFLTFTTAYCMGVFFSIALANVGHLGLIALLLLQLCRDRDFRRKCFDFHKTYKLWIPVVYIVLLAFVGSFRGNVPNGLSVFCKYVRMLSVLVLIPAFIGNHRLQKAFLYSFFISGTCYVLFKYLGYNSSPNIIHTSIYMSCILLYFIMKSLVTGSRKQCFIYNFLVIFATFSLFFVNREKTGALASIVAVAAVATITKRSLSRSSIVLFTFWGILSLSICQKTELWGRLANIKGPSYTHRTLMLQQARLLIKENPLLGVGTGNYPKALAEHNFSHLGAEGNKINPHAHPHNEWVMFCILWGILGLAGLIGLFGYIIHHFIIRIRRNNLVGENNFYIGFAFALVIIYFVSGCCEAVFFMTLPQSAFLFWLALCFAADYEQRHGNLVKQ